MNKKERRKENPIAFYSEDASPAIRRTPAILKNRVLQITYTPISFIIKIKK
jgi:hypothetical protein